MMENRLRSQYPRQQEQVLNLIDKPFLRILDNYDPI